MEALFCFKYLRTVGADKVVHCAGQRLPIGADQQRRSYAHARVQVPERLDGSLAVYYAGTCLRTTPASAEAPLLRARSGPRGTLRTAAGSAPAAPTPPKPRADHPWRTPVITSKRTQSSSRKGETVT